jgi:hypothetical protein
LRRLVGWDVLADFRAPHGRHLAPIEDDNVLAIARSKALWPPTARLLHFRDHVLAEVTLIATVAKVGGWIDLFRHYFIILSFSSTDRYRVAKAH